VTTYLLKINCELHIGGAAPRPNTASQWEGIEVTFPEPKRIKRSGGAPVQDGNTLLIWTHEYPGYGNGRGLTAKGIATNVRHGGEGVVTTLNQVELLTPHYSHREAQPHPTDSETIRYLRSMRLLRSYELSEDELSDLWSDVERFQRTKAQLLMTARPKTAEEKALDADREAVEAGYERRFALQEVRPEQGAFRASLMSLYKSRCVISGCSVPDVLQAAHIVPFSENVAYRNDLSNGLLLRSDIHTLFDRFLISIRPVDGTLFLADQLLTSGYRNYHGKKLNLKASPAFLGDHFKRFREVRAAESDVDTTADF
jgi:hypothetical protein